MRGLGKWRNGSEKPPPALQAGNGAAESPDIIVSGFPRGPGLETA
jgi:hypothetical protein